MMLSFKKAALPIAMIILQSCSGTLTQTGPLENNRGYFIDASNCFKTSMHMERIKVPTGGGMTEVEIPVIYNAGAFTNCMRFAGHKTPKVDLENYLTVSRQCYLEARGLSNADDVYADCVHRSRIGIELLEDDD
ncbi:hypothetical protein [Methylotuvimicrobium sp. KM1]|uniref:hypothetical protein n=1 Tax=Methylotuvimicrobium sp. KM1 TaxID=3377707 RepID=UPI00385009EA